jgi:hypothetical protein
MTVISMYEHLLEELDDLRWEFFSKYYCNVCEQDPDQVSRLVKLHDNLPDISAPEDAIMREMIAFSSANIEEVRDLISQFKALIQNHNKGGH